MRFFGARLSLGIAAVVALSTATVPADGFKLVAHSSVPTRTLSREALVQVFTKKTVKWPDGSRIVPIDLPVGSRTREKFSQAVHGKSAAVVDAYWQKQVFSGRDLPPLMKASDAEVVAYVRATPGAVGYVSPEADATGAKLIEME